MRIRITAVLLLLLAVFTCLNTALWAEDVSCSSVRECVQKSIELDKQGMFNESVAALENALRIEPNNTVVLVRAATTCMLIDQPERGLKYLEKANLLAPTDADILWHLGYMYHKAGRDKEAVATLLKSLEQKPNNKLAYYDLGLIYWNMNDDDKAAASYEKAIEIDPQFADAYYDLGCFYLDRANAQKAEANLVKAKELYQQIGDTQSVELVEAKLKEVAK